LSGRNARRVEARCWPSRKNGKAVSAKLVG
jgi:hypothetical protein